MLYISEPCQHDYNDTKRGQVNQIGIRRKKGQMDGVGGDQVSESAGNFHKRWEGLG